jgi:NAD(P)H dehydrogenase (quinone)
MLSWSRAQKPESFESIARRYVDNPSLIHPKLSNGGKLGALAFLARMMLTRVPDFDQWERDRGFPILNDPVLAHDSPEWRATAEKQELNLLPATAERFAHSI